MKTEWQYLAASGDKSTLALRVKFVLTEGATAARDKSVMRYLLAMSEQFEGRSFSINPAALCDLWAEAWFEGRCAATKERDEQPPPQAATPSPVPTGDSDRG